MAELSTLASELAEQIPGVDDIVAAVVRLEPQLARVKLRVMDADEVLELRKELIAETDFYANILFLIADAGGNHLGVWVKGSQAGRLVWHWHDEWDLVPVYRSFAHFERALAAQPDVDFYTDLVGDYPDLKGTATEAEVASDRKIIELYRDNLGKTEGEYRAMFAMTMMQVAPRSDLDSVVVPLLDDGDMYVQERAAVILGEHRYAPARAKLEEIARAGSPNGQLAAKGALNKLDAG